MVALPTSLPRTRPAAETLAIAPASLLQLTSPPSTAPFTSRSVAVSCIEAFTVRFAVAGLIEIELRTGLDTGSEGRSTTRSEEHTSELQSQSNIVCRLL